MPGLVIMPVEKLGETVNLVIMTAMGEGQDLSSEILQPVFHQEPHTPYLVRTELMEGTPADVYFGRGQSILQQRETIKRNTINQRRLQYRNHAA